ncbi:phosphopentomutase [Olsenella sp. HMSC062G07]|uniref:phosphopentomutase n=1 Tax=Olsenella sp. HMSC062G07 TaxID=1739330 RepID=UPI000A5D733D|nr:phosphopentomutase [Olsenella sp. HMSC062G07]
MANNNLTSRSETGRFIVIVLDGFGVGQMADVPRVRPADLGANTCVHIFESTPGLELPVLASMGLANACGKEFAGLPFSPSATWGRGALAHQGADTFYGHQEIMGTKPPVPLAEPIQGALDEIAHALTMAGHEVSFYSPSSSGLRFLIVDGACTVADNVECDPGQAFNVTAAIDDLDFEEELKIGRIVREIAKTPRVITFGGRGVHLADLLAAVREHDGFIGVDAPASGVYDNDYHCIHMGYGVDEKVQVPYILGEAGNDVHLLGKVADVCANRFGESESIVDTREVLERTLELVAGPTEGFICANVQETDLAGHGEDVARYADRLCAADELIGRIRSAMRPADVLVVMADHGNDPTIGHPHHTREHVPLLVAHEGAPSGFIGERATLSDIGASVADYFGVRAPQNGTSFWLQVKG